MKIELGDNAHDAVFIVSICAVIVVAMVAC